MSLLLQSSNGRWGSGALIDLISQLKDFLQGLLAELFMSYGLLHSAWELPMPKAKYPPPAATPLQLMLTHVIDEVIGQLAGLS